MEHEVHFTPASERLLELVLAISEIVISLSLFVSFDTFHLLLYSLVQCDGIRTVFL